MNMTRIAELSQKGMLSPEYSALVDTTILRVAEGFIDINPGCSLKEIYNHIDIIIPGINWINIGISIFIEIDNYRKDKKYEN